MRWYAVARSPGNDVDILENRSTCEKAIKNIDVSIQQTKRLLQAKGLADGPSQNIIETRIWIE